VFLNIIVQMVQIGLGLGLRQNGDSNDQHLKQDTKSNKEELKHEKKIQNTKQNQNRRGYHKKQSERRICRAADPMGIGP
jgi:hypothetical protein